MVVVGLGVGLSMQVLVLAVQNSVPHEDLGTATAAATFFSDNGRGLRNRNVRIDSEQPTCGRVDRCFPHAAKLGIDPKGLQASPERIQSLPAPVRQSIAEAFAQSLHVVFLAAVPVAIVAFVVVLLLREKPLKESAHVGGEMIAEDAGMPFELGLDPEQAPDIVGAGAERRDPSET